MATPNPVAPEQVSAPLRNAINDYHQACEAIEAWEERRTDAAELIISLLPPGSEVDGVAVMPPRRVLSTERAQAYLDPMRYAEICELRPVARKARDLLTDAELEQIYVTGHLPFVRRTS